MKNENRLQRNQKIGKYGNTSKNMGNEGFRIQKIVFPDQKLHENKRIQGFQRFSKSGSPAISGASHDK